jgi:hypothetical protein
LKHNDRPEIMSKQFVQNKYMAGDVVCVKVNPTIKLKIRRYIDQVYYCKVLDNPEAREFVYYERELVEDRELITKNEKPTT